SNSARRDSGASAARGSVGAERSARTAGQRSREMTGLFVPSREKARPMEAGLCSFWGSERTFLPHLEKSDAHTPPSASQENRKTAQLHMVGNSRTKIGIAFAMWMEGMR